MNRLLLSSLWLYAAVSAPVAGAQERRAVPFYRFDLHTEDAVEKHTNGAGLPGERLSFVFADRGAATWTAEDGAVKLDFDQGNMIVEAAEAGRALSPSRLGIAGNSVPTVRVRLQLTGTHQVTLAWRPSGKEWEPGAHYLSHVHVPEEGQWTTVDIETEGIHAWRSETIDQLAIAVPKGAVAKFEFIQLRTQAAKLTKDGLGTSLFELGSETRCCLSAKSPGSISYDLSVPGNAFMTTGLATVESYPPVRFLVRAAVEGADGEFTLLDKKLLGESRWCDEKIDMRLFGGEKVRITFETQTDEGANVALWSNPILYQPDANTYVSDGVSYFQRRAPGYKVVVYVIGALRADHLGIYGYSRETAPTLRELATHGAKFDWFFSNDVWTKPSIASLHVSEDRLVHRMNNFGDAVPDGLPMFPELLRGAGFVTGAISENPHAPPDTATPRLAYSHQYSANQRIPRSPKRLGSPELSAATLACAREFLDMYAERPFFLYVHTAEANRPYEPPAPFRGRFVKGGAAPDEIDRYDEEILWADSNLKAFTELLREFGIFDETALIVTSDNGVAFGEHENALQRGGKPFNELIHAPLVISFPRVITSGRVVTQNAQMLDLAPTVLDLMKLPPCESFKGMSLVPLINGKFERQFAERTIYSYEAHGEATAVIRGSIKYLMDPQPNASMLFQIREDPGEKGNLWAIREDAKEFVKNQTGRGDALRRGQIQAVVQAVAEDAEQPITLQQDP